MDQPLKRLIFRTAKSFGWLQIVYVGILFFGSIGVILLFSFGPVDPDESRLWSILLIVLLLFSLYSLSGFLRRWPIQINEVIIEGDWVSGKTVFGKPKEFRISNLTGARKHPSWINVQLESGEETFLFNPNMDFLGFLLDYIFIQNPSIQLNDSAELRNDYIFWSYTREPEFNTKYPDGYLESFIPILIEQREKLKTEGILEKDVFYGNDRDPLLNPDSPIAKIDRWFEKNVFKDNEKDQ